MHPSSEKDLLLYNSVVQAIDAIDDDTHEEYENVAAIIATRIYEGFNGLRPPQSALMYDIVEEIGVEYAVIVASMVSYAYFKGNRPEDKIPKVILLHALADYITEPEEDSLEMSVH